ncbi:MAG: hypothetical protein U5L96_05470 [Owenweeksia sp.]|nr:hypothetical protein [Owenweeksia sp.]
MASVMCPVALPLVNTLPLLVQFSPSTVGTFTDTISINNNDSVLKICVNATSQGAAVLNLPGDTLEVTVNKCKVIKSIKYPIQNTGLEI